MAKLVFIAGCFDGPNGLHEGHRYILSECAKLGRVVVALNRDSHVAKKGPGRPLAKLAARMRAVLESGHVVGAVEFGSDPLEWILRLKPDYICVGDDYTEDKVVGAKECAGWGGQVVIIPRIPGHSTTAMIKEREEGVSDLTDGSKGVE